MHFSFVRRLLGLSVVLSAACLGSLGQGVPSNFSLQINGQVRLADTKTPAENALVRLESFGGGMDGQIITDRTGKFSFSGLQPQRYVVTIHIPGYIDVRQDVELSTSPSGYVNALMVRDKNSIVNRQDPNQPLLHPPVIDSNVPIEAQTEYAAAQSILKKGETAKTTEAITRLDKAIALYPKYTEAHLAKGLAHMDLQEWEKAEKSLRTAAELTPNAATAYWALGDIYTRQKKYSTAEEALLKGIAANDQHAEGHFALANVYWEMAPAAKDETAFRKSLGSSWKEVRRALELNPKHARAHLLAGNLLLKARHADEALGHFEEYLKLEPKGELADQTRNVVQKIKQAMAQNTKNS